MNPPKCCSQPLILPLPCRESDLHELEGLGNGEEWAPWHMAATRSLTTGSVLNRVRLFVTPFYPNWTSRNVSRDVGE